MARNLRRSRRAGNNPVKKTSAYNVDDIVEVGLLRGLILNFCPPMLFSILPAMPTYEYHGVSIATVALLFSGKILVNSFDSHLSVLKLINTFWCASINFLADFPWKCRCEGPFGRTTVRSILLQESALVSEVRWTTPEGRRSVRTSLLKKSFSQLG